MYNITCESTGFKDGGMEINMAILIFIFNLHLKLLYFLFKLLPVDKRKVVFLSRNFDSPSLDYRLLNDELKKSHSELYAVFLTRRIHKGIFQLIGYYFHTLRQLYHIATTNVCVLDSYIIPISVLKHRRTLRVIQLWHAMGAIKKFGYQTLDTKYGRSSRLSRMMRMHENYDYVISGSQAMIPYFSEAFNVPYERFVPTGMPRIDYIVNKKNIIRKRIRKKYPALTTKPVILYVPTFRPQTDDALEHLINQVDFSKYILIIKKHPNDKRTYTNDCVTSVDGFSSLDLLTVADYVVTDYSAITIEAAALEKQIYFYVYDYEQYCESNGLNLDLFELFPDGVFKDAAGLMHKIEQNEYDLDVVRKFKRTYVINNGDATKRIANLINE